MFAFLTSTEAKVRNHQAVQVLLDSYECDDVEIWLTQQDDGWVLLLAPVFDDWCWPTAIRVEEVLDPNQYPDEESYEEAMCELRGEKGSEGFRDLLRNIAPHLESPLLILLGNLSYDSGATAWCIQPGATEPVRLAIG